MSINIDNNKYINKNKYKTAEKNCRTKCRILTFKKNVF